jgi:hypothetical protein
METRKSRVAQAFRILYTTQVFIRGLTFPVSRFLSILPTGDQAGELEIARPILDLVMSTLLVSPAWIDIQAKQSRSLV